MECIHGNLENERAYIALFDSGLVWVSATQPFTSSFWQSIRDFSGGYAPGRAVPPLRNVVLKDDDTLDGMVIYGRVECEGKNITLSNNLFYEYA